MIINVHAGHNADGNRACGAVGLIRESTEARKVKNLLIDALQLMGHTVYDCTVDNALTQGFNLSGIVKKCKEHNADLNISIHFNAGGGNGTEVLLYNSANAALNTYAKNVCEHFASLGYRNRGTKYRTDLYVLRNLSNCMLIECCFVDSAEDVAKYNAQRMADAICTAICGKVPTTNASTTKTESFLIKPIIAGLNIRKGPGMEYAVVGQVRKGIKYTILEVHNNWGRLKSGAGWICLDTSYVDFL